MIVYFSDRQMQVMGLASTNLPDGFVIIEDLKTEEIETGVATFSCRIGFNDENRLELESMTNAGNFLLRSHNGENEFYTIIDTEIDTKNQTINIYAEDAGLDLLNEIADDFEATEAHDVAWYVNKYIDGTGFEIGINEVSTASTRKLKWEGEETVTSRLASIATQFGGFEISYSFEIHGLAVTKKYVNIHKERGKDAGITLRLNRDIDKIITTKSVANLATAFLCEGGVPDKAENPITFSSTNYTWKDEENDFYIEGDLLKSRNAIQKWSRQAVKLYKGEGVIVRPYSYNTTDPATLRAHAVTELKKVCDMEVNYEVDISVLPESVKIGDRINIVDDGGELYLSARVLVLETSVVDQKHSAVLGEHLIKTSGISQKVADLAEQFAKTSVSAAQALNVAKAANAFAEDAKAQAEKAATELENARTAAEEANAAAQTAVASASEANAKADAAQGAVGEVSATVSEMETLITEAEQLAESAKASADIATAQSSEAKTAAQNAATKADEAKSAATEAQTSAASAIATASTASTKADEAKTNAEAASTVAAAAKLDSEQAKKDVEEFANSLETFEATMSANYARKTELTETTAALDARITANANQLSITHSKVLVIDETANNAKDLAEAAQTAASGAQATAATAQETANTAVTNAATAQDKADQAATDAATAKAAADAADAKAAAAQTDLNTAKTNLESVKSRVDATEEEIAAAEQAVALAQKAADDAAAAAVAAQSTADTAQANAATAKTAADNAKKAADDAQAAADAAQEAADKAQSDVNALTVRVTSAETEIAKSNEQILLRAKKTDVDAIIVGGRNLFYGYEGEEVIELGSIGANECYSAIKGHFTFDPADTPWEQYTISFWAKSPNGTTRLRLYNINEPIPRYFSFSPVTFSPVGNEWKHFSHTIVNNDMGESRGTENCDRLEFHGMDQVGVQIKNIKIEWGNKASAWEPAPEDVDSKFLNYYTKEQTKAELNVAADNITSTVSSEIDDKVSGLKTEAMTEIQQLKNKLSMLVVGDGKTLMEQTDSGWSFSFSKATGDIEEIKTALAKNAEYIKFGTVEDGKGGTEPCIELGVSQTNSTTGEVSDGKYKVLITNTRIIFKEGSATPTYISNETLVSEKVEVTQELQHTNADISGRFVWKMRSNGNLGLSWKGV